MMVLLMACRRYSGSVLAGFMGMLVVLCFCWFSGWISVSFGLFFLRVNDVVLLVEVWLATATTPTVKGGSDADLYGGGSGVGGDESGGGGCAEGAAVLL
jgi:hypothetical protein